MKLYRSSAKNIAYTAYRLISPVFDPITFVTGILGYIWFIIDFIRFRNGTKEPVLLKNLFPMLHDKSRFTPFDAHYYFQQLWVFENVLKAKPVLHIDIASTYEMSGYLSKIVPTEFVDIRPVIVAQENLKVVDGSILSLPYPSGSLTSVSCLHVIEHIGLGRYGDKIDPEGLEKACAELSRVVAKGGILYLSTPIGTPRICFNAHRVNSPSFIRSLFPDFELVSFNVVSDNGEFRTNVSVTDFENSVYALGMYCLRRVK